MVRDNARRIALGPLSANEAVTVLSTVIGADRVQAEPRAAAELARACAYLPLALRIAAAILTEHPCRRISEQLARRWANGPLTSLTVGSDERSALRLALASSYAKLDATPAQVFRRLGLVASTDFTVATTAALAGLSLAEAERVLDELASAHLVEARGSGVYAFHGLLHSYATELISAERYGADGGEGCRRADG